MVEKQIYTGIYNYLNDATPLPFDCGKLCGRRCCKGDGGMYLFPGEEVMHKKTFLNITDSAFTYCGKAVLFAACEGICEREKRPLSCRIFPLFPYLKRGQDLRIITDPRAYAICPLTSCEPDRHFYKKVKRAILLLMKFEPVREFLYEYTLLVEEARFGDFFE